mmetsp:Transcript_18429/g.27312  ORF Transcript_18429/g.27312 Transcript_18429/m.27312 type:complete len:742 (-) Transcript_18429:150-2375(-)
MREKEEIRCSGSFESQYSSDDFLEVLQTRPKGVLFSESSISDKYMIEKTGIQGIIFPWDTGYKIWSTFTVIGAMLTLLFNPYQIAFESEPGALNDSAAVIELILTAIFIVDILVKFNLAFYENGILVFTRREICLMYFKKMFWIDFFGVFPFETFFLLVFGKLGNDDDEALIFSLFRLLRIIRLHRLKELAHFLHYESRVSLLWFTLLRNFGVTLALTHVEACIMYFLARYHGFDENTWLGPLITDMTGFERYVTSLYWSIVTFCTVGYGDFTSKNSTEMIFSSFFMLVNIVVAAWIIGSITLLVVKGDESTRDYRENLETLHRYGEMHQLDQQFMNKLQSQLRLEFNNRDFADEQVLRNFPSAVRHKILRTLYLQPLNESKLFHGIRPQFVDAFLISCKVEIFSPGEQLLESGSILSDLFLLVGGIAENDSNQRPLTSQHRKLETGDFIGEIGFFTDSPQKENVKCLTVCKTLTMPRSTYKVLAEHHPGCVSKILQNLLDYVEKKSKSESIFNPVDGYGSVEDEFYQLKEDFVSVKELVKMHMRKQLDDQTTRLLFAASRGDTNTISLMCDQGFDPNNKDYDSRTALMVASMKGNTDVVKMLLSYRANPNLIDMHGSTALLEAVKNGHEDTIGVLFNNAAELCMPESLAASVLCQAVYDGDCKLLQRLLKANIQVNAADYDKRTAAHIAASEGSVAALNILAKYGADLALKDRWGKTALDERERLKSTAQGLQGFTYDLL